MSCEKPSLEWYAPTLLLTMARFGQWGELIRSLRPPKELRFTTGLWHHVRGLAFAATTRFRKRRGGIVESPEVAESLPGGEDDGREAESYAAQGCGARAGWKWPPAAGSMRREFRLCASASAGDRAAVQRTAVLVSAGSSQPGGRVVTARGVRATRNRVPGGFALESRRTAGPCTDSCTVSRRSGRMRLKKRPGCGPRGLRLISR